MRLAQVPDYAVLVTVYAVHPCNGSYYVLDANWYGPHGAIGRLAPTLAQLVALDNYERYVEPARVLARQIRARRFTAPPAPH